MLLQQTTTKFWIFGRDFEWQLHFDEQQGESLTAELLL